MKKFVSLILILLILCGVLIGCEEQKPTDNQNSQTTDENIGDAEDTDRNNSAIRNPMPTYEKLGAKNYYVTSDGRYIYYSVLDTSANEGSLCRTDINGQNSEVLYTLSNHKFTNLYINDGYLYFPHGMNAVSIDIAKAPNYFNGKNGYVAYNNIVDGSFKSKFMGTDSLQADEEYIYFSSTGIWRVKKDDPNQAEQLVYSENLVNFYGLNLINGYLYGYCGDDQKLYRFDKNGTNATEICKPMKSYVIYSNSVYYIVNGSNNTQQLTKTKLDGSGTETITTLGEGWVSATLYNAMDNLIYYVYEDENDVYTLKTFNIKTSEIKSLCQLENEYIDFVDIVGDFVFFRYGQQDLRLMRMKLDGSELTQLTK